MYNPQKSTNLSTEIKSILQNYKKSPNPMPGQFIRTPLLFAVKAPRLWNMTPLNLLIVLNYPILTDSCCQLDSPPISGDGTQIPNSIV